MNLTAGSSKFSDQRYFDLSWPNALTRLPSCMLLRSIDSISDRLTLASVFAPVSMQTFLYTLYSQVWLTFVIENLPSKSLKLLPMLGAPSLPPSAVPARRGLRRRASSARCCGERTPGLRRGIPRPAFPVAADEEYGPSCCACGREAADEALVPVSLGAGASAGGEEGSNLRWVGPEVERRD